MKTNRRHFSGVKFFKWYKANSACRAACARPHFLDKEVIIAAGRDAYENGDEDYEMSGFDTKSGRPQIFHFR